MKRYPVCLSILFLLVLGLFGDLKEPCSAPYPTRPIKVMVPAAAGGSLGQEIRTIIPFLEKNLKVSIMIDYVTGADGMIAYNKFQKEKPDGYSLLHFNLLAALPLELTRETAKYEVKTFSPVAVWNFKSQAFIVHPDSWKTFPELLNEAKKRNVKKSWNNMRIEDIARFGFSPKIPSICRVTRSNGSPSILTLSLNDAAT